MAASGIINNAQKKDLLHVGDPGLRKILSNFNAEQSGADDDFNTAKLACISCFQQWSTMVQTGAQSPPFATRTLSTLGHYNVHTHKPIWFSIHVLFR